MSTHQTPGGESALKIIGHVMEKMKGFSWEIVAIVPRRDVTGKRQDCKVFGHEYVDQSGPGIMGDDFRGYTHLPIGGKYLKIWYST